MPRNTRLNRWKQRWRRMSPWTKVTVITGLVIGFSGSITGVRAAWPIIKLGLPAPIIYVDGSIFDVEGRFTVAQQSQTSILRDLQIESADGKRAAANNAAANWKLERLKTQDPVTKGLIDQQISNQEAELERLNDQIKTLKTLKAQGR